MGKGNDPNCTAALSGAGMDLAPDLQAMDEPQLDQLWLAARGPIDREHQALAENRRTQARYRKRNYPVPDYLTAREQQLSEKIAALAVTLEPFKAEWDRRGGWTRAYLVLNADGHVHASTACSTLRPSTQIAWLPELSGQDEQQIIAHAGHTACTVCYPQAPTHPAYIASAKQAEQAQAAKQKDVCAGSGQQGTDLKMQYASPRGRCPVCRQTIGVSRHGKVRRHKPPVT